MIRKFREYIRIILQLSKVKITVAVSLTTITGYVLGRGYLDTGFIGVTIGIFLLACGASVMNHIQESGTDARMQRTRNRPIPSGSITRFGAFILFITETLAGAVILYMTSGAEALLLGLLAMAWYNGVYTYLKRLTAHAVIPGSVIGAIPPLVGWVTSGAGLMDPRAWTIALFFFVWQVPHFYLLVMKYGTQYEEAGFPSLTGKYDHGRIRLLIFLWILTTALASLLLYFFSVIHSRISVIIILIASLWLIAVFIKPLIKKKEEFLPIKYFLRINFYVLIVIVILNLDFLFTAYLI